MRITPLEIRQKEFEKNFRGYDKDEVNAFLQTLSQEWERVMEENRDMRYKLEVMQREVDKMREMEGSLFKALKTAEDTGANMIEQANKKAEMRLAESQAKAEEMLSQAKERARSIVEKSESKAQQVIDEMQRQVITLRHSYQEAQEDYDELLSKLKALASDILQKVESAEEKPAYDIAQRSEEVQQEIQSAYAAFAQSKNEEEENHEEKEEAPSEPVALVEKEEYEPEPEENIEEKAWTPEVVDNNEETSYKPDKRKSFFDEID